MTAMMDGDDSDDGESNSGPCNMHSRKAICKLNQTRSAEALVLALGWEPAGLFLLAGSLLVFSLGWKPTVCPLESNQLNRTRWSRTS